MTRPTLTASEAADRGRPGGHPPGSGAFTLVELLVVIAIIGLLLGIAIPAVQHARHSAANVRCLSNLKQIGNAVSQYLETESGGRMPTLFNRLDTSDGRPAMDTVFLDDAHEREVFRCPADDTDLYETTGNSYFWNQTLNGQPAHDLYFLVGGDNPTYIPVVADKEAFHPSGEFPANRLYADFHIESGEIIFVAGEP